MPTLHAVCALCYEARAKDDLLPLSQDLMKSRLADEPELEAVMLIVTFIRATMSRLPIPTCVLPKASESKYSLGDVQVL